MKNLVFILIIFRAILDFRVGLRIFIIRNLIDQFTSSIGFDGLPGMKGDKGECSLKMNVNIIFLVFNY